MGYIDLRLLCRCKKFFVASYYVYSSKLNYACVFAESYHELQTVEYFFKTTFDVQYVPVFIISFIFGSTELYVTENGIESLRLGLQFFKSNDLSRWSTLSIRFLTVYNIYIYVYIYIYIYNIVFSNNGRKKR